MRLRTIIEVDASLDASLDTSTEIDQGVEQTEKLTRDIKQQQRDRLEPQVAKLDQSIENLSQGLTAGQDHLDQADSSLEDTGREATQLKSVLQDLEQLL